MVVYVNWNERKVVSEKAYAVMLADTASEMSGDYDLFGQWLDDNYTASTVFRYVREYGESCFDDEFNEYCDECAETELAKEWEKVEVDA